MAPYRRPDSPFWWLCLEIPGQRPIRERTAIPVDGGTEAQTKANAVLARQAYAAKMGDLARQRYELKIDRPRILFSKYRAWYYDHISTTKRNQTRERSMLTQLGAYFDDMDVGKIARQRIIEWRTARAKDVAPATVNRELALLKHLLTTAVPQYLNENPAAGLSQLRVPEQDVRLLEPDEETRLLAVCNNEERAILICALDTLQRLSSVVGLKRAQDHGDHLVVLNPKVKGYKVPVSSRLRKALDALPGDGPYYFPSVQGANDQVRRNKTIRMFAELLTRAKLPRYRKLGGLSFHCLRHTGASRMLARGVDIKTVQQLGGWHNLAVLEKYLHPTDAQKQAAVEVVSREQPVNRSVRQRGDQSGARARRIRVNRPKSAGI